MIVLKLRLILSNFFPKENKDLIVKSINIM